MTRLVTNGCSYMATYSNGGGPTDLATQLNIKNSASLAIAGCCNSRIIRTTLKDSYLTNEKTFYVIGLTFLDRGELPINAEKDPFEGRWISTQNFQGPDDCKYTPLWSQSSSKKYMELEYKTKLSSAEDRLEQLMYSLLGTISDLLRRGHQVLVFRQPEDLHDCDLGSVTFTPLNNCVNIVDGLKWAAIPWQADNNVKSSPNDAEYPPGVRHILAGEHDLLNKFLVEYINKHALHLPVL